MNEELKIGDIVQLKSGGPKMTVEELSVGAEKQFQRVKCSWFDGKGEFNTGWLELNILIKKGK